MIEEQINKDLKTALLGGDKVKATLLRGLKSALLYVKVEKGVRDEAMPDSDVIAILQKEAKKRQESADLYVQGGSQEKADTELAEKAMIEVYLPQQLTETEVSALIDEAVAENGPVSKETMGATIAAVKQKSNGAADGALIARLVKERINPS